MVFDNRYYAGASPLHPALYHARAPAAGDLCSGALRAAYFFSLHQATLIGTQTWTLRRRRSMASTTLASATLQRIAEWSAVHLAAHHTHVVAELWVATHASYRLATIEARAVATDNTTTATGPTVSLDAREQTEFSRVAGLAAYRLPLVVPLSTLTLPTEAARVYIEASASDANAAVYRVVPLSATAWREVRP